MTPTKRLRVKVDYLDCWLATVQDGLYNGSNVRTVFNAKATSTHVGRGVDTQIVMTLPQSTTVGMGLGTLSAGEYLKQSGKRTGYVYPSLWLSKTF